MPNPSVLPRPTAVRRPLAALGLVAALLLSFLTVLAPSAQAVAYGCTPSRPTRVYGEVYSFPHAYSVNSFTGVVFSDINHHLVTSGGAPTTYGGYDTYAWINRSMPNYGDPSRHGTRIWGSVCVAANVAYASIESYPSRLVGTVTRVTDKTYFGAAADEFDRVTPGGTNRFDMRLPEDRGVNSPASFQQMTGMVNGYLHCGAGCGANNGRTIPTSALVLRAFPYEAGGACGVQGFSAGADLLGPSSTPGKGVYYRLDHLAGGQCGTPGQPYQIIVTCSGFCGASNRTLVRVQTITTGAGAGLDFTF